MGQPDDTGSDGRGLIPGEVASQSEPDSGVPGAMLRSEPPAGQADAEAVTPPVSIALPHRYSSSAWTSQPPVAAAAAAQLGGDREAGEPDPAPQALSAPLPPPAAEESRQERPLVPPPPDPPAPQAPLSPDLVGAAPAELGVELQHAGASYTARRFLTELLIAMLILAAGLPVVLLLT